MSHADPLRGLWTSRTEHAGEAAVQGYGSSSSVQRGQTIDFHISVAEPGPVSVAVHRVGWYDGAGTTMVHNGPSVPGSTQASPISDPDTGLRRCDWSSTWTLAVPGRSSSGLYIAEFTTAGGARAFTPFVVREDERRADLCVVLPFATYQAENLWSGGPSLSYGYRDGELRGYNRAVKVSFERPYAGDGLPRQLDSDRHAIAWIEEQGYDAVYVTDVDVHAGLVDLSRFDGVVFPGATAYWSMPMREALTGALDAGRSAVFLSARNLFWHARFEDRVLVCYKDRPDPDPRDGMASVKWRIPRPGPGRAEQELLGTQFIADVPRPTPLVVSRADHWFWAGTGVRDDDAIPDLIAEVADGYDQRYPSPAAHERTLLAMSPLFITDQGERRIQHTSISESASGLVFAAGTPRWAHALADPSARDERIRTATANLVDRVRLQPLLVDGSRRVSIPVENLRRGSGRWRVADADTTATSVEEPEIEGYASATSVAPGARLGFHIRSAQPYTVAVHRLGDYDGLGSRLVAESGQLPAADQPPCDFDDRTRRAACDWTVSWHLDVHEGLTSGLYVAVFTTLAGQRALTPFVVTDPHSSARICVVLPFLTYQASNRWPLDGVRGTSLAYGYVADTSSGATYRTRAVEVSFDRPYPETGLPDAMTADIELIGWLERDGFDVTYVTDQDVHAGVVDAARFGGLVFPGQHEYWTRPLRDWVERAVHSGVSLAFLGAATSHWHARLEAGRTLACYKSDPDPVGDPAQATARWRAQPGPGRHEQLLTGTSLAGRTTLPAALVARAGEHWVWAGTGVDDSTAIDAIVAGQVDGLDPAVGGPGTRTVLASSPFILAGKETTEVQTTAVSELPNGAFVFSAGTQEWQSGIAGEHADARIQVATANVLRRMSAAAPAIDETPAKAHPLRQMWHRVRTGLRSGKI